MKNSMMLSMIMLCLAALPLGAEGPFAVKAAGNDFAILYRGRVLVKSVTGSNLADVPPSEVRHSEQTMPDGAKVWNLWREDREKCIRLEIALAIIL